VSFSAKESNKTKTRSPVEDFASTIEDKSVTHETTRAVNEYNPLISFISLQGKREIISVLFYRVVTLEQ
jgi:hypothetical protein